MPGTVRITNAEILDLTRGSELAVSTALLDLQCSVLRRAHQVVGDDLASALILCELAHRATAESLSPATNGALAKPSAQRFTSVNSLATVTAIPRETVRRRIASLAKRGWLQRNSKGSVALTPAGVLRALGSHSAGERAIETVRAARSLVDLLDRKRRKAPH